MERYEIRTPVTKPETEWVRGRALQKMSPTTDHARLQSAVSSALAAWSAGRGEVGTEWRFRIIVPGDVRRPLVPDVAFVRNERLRALDDDEYQMPPLAPDVAVEVLSAGDRTVDLASKIDVYLRGGGSLVVVIDPKRRTIRAIDAHGERTYAGDDVFAHAALPGFALVVEPFFEAALRRVR